MSGIGEWEGEADNWARWARAAGHDAYWYFRDTFFDEVVPSPGRLSIDIGCGEGRVSRDLIVRGHRVVGVDSSPALAGYSRREDAIGSYLAGDGAYLPLRDGCSDLVVAYNSLQVVPDMAGTIREAARVLTTAGLFCFCVAHPITDIGRFDGDGPDARFIVRDDYFARRRVDDTVERDGLRMTFRGWTYSLEDYVGALEAVGLMIETVREPRPLEGQNHHERWVRIPMFLMVRAVKR